MKLRELGNTSIRFKHSTDAAAASVASTHSAGVTVNKISPGIPAVPAHFETTFFIVVEHEVEGFLVQNDLTVHSVVPEKDPATSNIDVESSSVRLLPTFFRDLADLIDQHIQRSEQDKGDRG